MKVLRVYNQHRRDCWVDFECENCGHKETYESGYDDHNFWNNVVPDRKCPKCKKTTKELGLRHEKRKPRYLIGQVV